MGESPIAGTHTGTEYSWPLVLFASLFLVAGSLHFFYPRTYARIVPPFLPYPVLLVYMSGAAEVLGGAGLLIPSLRPAAGYGLALLLVAVFPANIYMAVNHVPAPGILGASWAQWLRLPIQIPLIWWALWCAKH